MVSIQLIMSFLGLQMASASSDHTSIEWQIAAYSSAAPSFLGDYATVVDSGFEVLREGSNGWTCLPGNPRGMPEDGWANAHQAMPLCLDYVGFQWIAGYFAGEAPTMDRDTFGWMLHGDVGEDNTMPGVMSFEENVGGPENWIESGPHLMLFPKDPATLEGYPTDPMAGEPYVMFPGSPYTHLMIPCPDYYKYTDAAVLSFMKKEQPAAQIAPARAAISFAPIAMFAAIVATLSLVVVKVKSARSEPRSDDPQFAQMM
jgi:hypothetical protein